MVAIVGVDAELVDHLECVFAPVFDVDQGIEKRRPVIPLEIVSLAQTPGGGKNVGGDDLVQQTGKLGLRQMHPV